MLDDFLAHIDTRKEIGVEHGKEIGKFFDESFVVQGIKGCQITNSTPNKDANGIPDGTRSNFGGWEDMKGTGLAYPVIARTAPEGFQGGTVVMLDAAGDELDPELLELKIQDMCQTIEEKDKDVSEAVILMRPAQYYTLLKNNKLIDSDFSNNGDYSKGKVLMANGVRIMTTNRFPTEIHTGGNHHYLSNAGNDYAYDVTQSDLDCQVLLLMPKALLAGETIPLTSKVYYSDIELQWFIDSYLAYGVTPNNSTCIGGIFKHVPIV